LLRECGWQQSMLRQCLQCLQPRTLMLTNTRFDSGRSFNLPAIWHIGCAWADASLGVLCKLITCTPAAVGHGRHS
jgi:hypothetical protein